MKWDELLVDIGPILVGMALTAFLARGVARLEPGVAPRVVKAGLWLPWAAWHLTLGIVAAVSARARGLMYVDVGAIVFYLIFLPVLTLMITALFQAIVWTRADSVSRKTPAPQRIFEIYRSPYGLALLVALTGFGVFIGSRADLLEIDAPTRSEARK